MKKTSLIKGKLSVNRRISYNASRTDTIQLKRPNLKIKKVFNWQISKEREVLIEIICRLSEDGSREVNEL